MPVITVKHVIPANDSPRYFRLRMMETLKKQGQIEPLQVKHYCHNGDGTETYITFYEDAHGSDIVWAARSLGWDTLLIDVKQNGKYEF